MRFIILLSLLLVFTACQRAPGPPAPPTSSTTPVAERAEVVPALPSPSNTPTPSFTSTPSPEVLESGSNESTGLEEYTVVELALGMPGDIVLDKLKRNGYAVKSSTQYYHSWGQASENSIFLDDDSRIKSIYGTSLERQGKVVLEQNDGLEKLKKTLGEPSDRFEMLESPLRHQLYDLPNSKQLDVCITTQLAQTDPEYQEAMGSGDIVNRIYQIGLIKKR